MKPHAACTLFAPPALTAHAATYASPCALHLPWRAPPSEPQPPAPGRALPPGLHLRPCPSRASLHLAWRRPQRILRAGKGSTRSPRRRLCPEPPGGPHLKPAASPVPRPLGGASVLTLTTARAPRGGGGLHVPGRSAGHWSKSLRAAWASGAAEAGARARLAGTRCRARWLLATPGRARGAGGRHPAPRTPAGCGGAGEGVESLLQAAWSRQRVPCPGPLPSRWRRAASRARRCPSSSRPSRRPAARGPARERPLGQQGRGRSEINNARKRNTDVSRARASPPAGAASRPRARRRRQRRCSDASSPSSEAIVYWALHHLLTQPRG